MGKKRAYSVSEVLAMKHETMGFTDKWFDAFGTPNKYGVIFIWGNSGNGKSSFLAQLTKELCKYHKKILIDSCEEGVGLSFQNNMRRAGMLDVKSQVLTVDYEPIDELTERLKKKKSADVVIIDSYPYVGFRSFKQYRDFTQMFKEKKLLIFTGHARGSKPSTPAQEKVMYDADVKIFVEGYKAYCKGRFVPSLGNSFTIWEEGAERVLNNGGEYDPFKE